MIVSYQDGRAYYKQTGVGPLPVVLYNGVPYQREQLDPDEMETVTMQKILETTSFYQRAVYLVSQHTRIHTHPHPHTLIYSHCETVRFYDQYCFIVV